MLLDINSPKSKAILEAARYLDAVHLLWRASEVAPITEVESCISRLRHIALEHFPDSRKIEGWLVELAVILKKDLADRSGAKARYDELISMLDGDDGFQTVYI